MEVTTVSRSTTSPPEGDNPCGIHVTSVAIGAVTLLICLCGLARNGAVLCILGFSIYRKPITVYNFHLAITDFNFLFLIITSTLLFLPEHVSCSTLVPWEYLLLIFQLLLFSYNLGLYLLMAISFHRCRSTLCLLWCHCHRPQHPSKVVSAMLGIISITVIPTLTSLLRTRTEEHFLVVVIFMYILNLLLFAAPMAISSTPLFIQVMRGSQHQPPERLNVLIFLTVLFGLPSILCNFLHLLGYNIHTQVVFLLTCIHSTSTPFVCFSEGRCWRPCSMGSLWLSLQRVLGEPEETAACSNDAAMGTAVPAC